MLSEQITSLFLLLMLSALKTIEVELPLKKGNWALQHLEFLGQTCLLGKASHCIYPICQSIGFYLL